jgi:NAD(P)-dependent dehydrogenase (short-subunit alcohol dehydrogenase family)
MNTKQASPPTAVVTGGTAGIGRAIALSLAEEGYSLIIGGRREESEVSLLMREIEEISPHSRPCTYVRGDISRHETRKKFIDTIEERGGQLHVLINNAGITTKNRKDMLELSEDDMMELLGVNLIAPFLLSAALVPFLRSENDVSYIISISSISAYTASANRADYCISKAGLSMMTKLFADRLAGENIRVFEIRPGIIRTEMTEPVAEKYDALITEGLLPLSRWGEPEDVARAVIGIVRGFFPYSTGDVLNVDGGFHIRRL